MIITCVGCDTRFQVADGRIPATGAWVRCSRCHHRFCVTPTSDASPSGSEGENSAPPKSEEISSSTLTDLDNPEFLFDRAEEDSDAADVGDEAPMQIEGSSTPMPEDLAESGWQERPADGDFEQEAGESTADSEPSEGLGAEEVSFAGIGTDSDVDASAIPDLDEDEDPLESWDTLAAGKLPDPPPGGSAGSPGGSAFERPAAVGKQPDPAAAPVRPELTSKAPDLESFTLRVLAIMVAVGLSAGGVKAVALYGMGEMAGPESVNENGWQASELQSFRLRDGSGRPVFVVRGKLYRDKRHAPLLVQATLLDQSGRAVADPTSAVLRRLSDDELSPDALSERLVGDDGWTRPRTPAIVRGFTVLVPEPPEEARRFRLELLPRS